jgi:hypothetical protein
MENDRGGLSLLEIDVLDRWAPFHSSNGSCASRLGCKSKGNKLIIGWHLNSYFNIWNIRHWKLMKVGEIGLWFKQNCKLWNNIMEQHMELIIALKEGATM